MILHSVCAFICIHGDKGCFHPHTHILCLQRVKFTQDNPQASLCLPVSLWSIYAFIHLPVTACVRPSMKKLLRLGFVSKCWGPPPPSLRPTTPPPPPSFPLRFFLSISLRIRLSLGLMGSPRKTPIHPSTTTITKHPPSCGSGSVPALVIDPSGPSRHIQQWVEQNHH